jgi:hypothetical protein
MINHRLLVHNKFIKLNGAKHRKKETSLSVTGITRCLACVFLGNVEKYVENKLHIKLKINGKVSIERSNR